MLVPCLEGFLLSKFLSGGYLMSTMTAMLESVPTVFDPELDAAISDMEALSPRAMAHADFVSAMDALNRAIAGRRPQTERDALLDALKKAQETLQNEQKVELFSGMIAAEKPAEAVIRAYSVKLAIAKLDRSANKWTESEKEEIIDIAEVNAVAGYRCIFAEEDWSRRLVALNMAIAEHKIRKQTLRVPADGKLGKYMAESVAKTVGVEERDLSTPEGVWLAVQNTLDGIVAGFDVSWAMAERLMDNYSTWASKGHAVKMPIDATFRRQFMRIAFEAVTGEVPEAMA